VADLKPIALDGGRLQNVGPASDRLVVGALLRLVGSLTFEDEDIGPVTLQDLARYRLPKKNLAAVGPINGVNTVYALPNSDKAIVETSGVTIETKYNGQDLVNGVGNDIVLSESGGVGAGFDTITFMNFAPKAGDVVTVSYFKDP
jgi:hypothetical protein